MEWIAIFHKRVSDIEQLKNIKRHNLFSTVDYVARHKAHSLQAFLPERG